MATGGNQDALPLPGFEEPTRLLLVVAPYVESVTNMLVSGAQARVRAAGGSSEVISVPGALEIPPAIRLASHSDEFDGFVALGCVMRGETTHYETVCQESARGLTLLGLAGLCIGNGILTVEDVHQAVARAAPDQQDKGGDAAAAALHLVALARRFGSPAGSVGFRLQDEVQTAQT